MKRACPWIDPLFPRELPQGSGDLGLVPAALEVGADRSLAAPPAPAKVL